jgi:hypothetical protein
VVSRNVQSSASKASGASLAGQKFGAAKGPTGLSLPAGLSTAGSVAVKIAVIDRSINTYGADSDVEPESDMVGGAWLNPSPSPDPTPDPSTDPSPNPDPNPDWA